MPQIWRSKESYLSKDISKRESQLKNLKSEKNKEKSWGNLAKFEGAEGFKLFMTTHCRNLEGKVPIILPWYDEVIEAIFNETEEEKVDLVIASTQKKAGKSFLGACLAIYWALFVDSPCEIVCRVKLQRTIEGNCIIILPEGYQEKSCLKATFPGERK